MKWSWMSREWKDGPRGVSRWPACPGSVCLYSPALQPILARREGDRGKEIGWWRMGKRKLRKSSEEGWHQSCKGQDFQLEYMNSNNDMTSPLQDCYGL